MRTVFHPAASRELVEIAVYYDRELPGLGSDFLNELDRVLSLLAENPQLGAVFEPPFRRALMQQFPFSVYYAVESNRIKVMAIAHQSRKQGYWTGRR